MSKISNVVNNQALLKALSYHMSYALPFLLGPVCFLRLNLQQTVWYLGKVESMKCGYPPITS
ncbi:hypothetical protein FFU37_10870 [Pseudoalteromonas distincta]|uniref:Uncharacterized protein n=1 Tax=Pseudoalteromonas distincta TaxID=77608 RepID=A0A4P9J298_9GAMM|nr:hypothetical protein FFU37_10870 [Pseudoalteromonas distincta]